MLFPLTGHKVRHVLMTTDAIGGVWTYALDLGSVLVRRGLAVTLAVLGPPSSAEQLGQATERGLVVAHMGCPPDWLAADEGEVASAAVAVDAMARLLGVGIVHLNHPALAAAVRFDRPVVAFCHSCVASWWDTVRGTPLPADFRWRTELVRRGLDAADAVAAPSASFAEETRRVYALAERPAVVHNGRAPPAEAAVLPPSRFVFTAGRLWDEGKNVAALERVAPRLGAPVEAAGALVGPNGAAITLEAVAALGPLDEAGMRAKLSRRPVYAAPALYEPFGLAVLEAAQARCALVLGDIPTFRELWNGAAVFVDPRDDETLEAGIAGLLSNPGWRNALGAAAADRASRYTVDATADATLRVYEAAAAVRRRTAA